MKPYFYNRELSYLKFNKRVLEQIYDENVPLFEKMKFLAIFASNLDEFFMIRVGSLYEKSLLREEPVDNKTGMNASEQLSEIYKNCALLYKESDRAFDYVMTLLKKEQLVYDNLKEREKPVKNYFRKEIMPLLSPQIIDSKHPFPHLYNKQTYIIAGLKNNEKESYGIIPLNKFIERIIIFREETAFTLAEDIIYRFLKEIFKSFKIASRAVIRITRNADITAESSFSDDDVDYREYMNEILKKRGKLAPVRLEIKSEKSSDIKKIKKYISSKLNLRDEQCFISEAPLGLDFLYSLKTGSASGSYPPFTQSNPPDIAIDKPIIPQLKKGDILLAYPYHSMKTYLNLLSEAVANPNVVSIKITLYRLNSESKIIEYLCEAAEKGKEVTAVVELNARFDEENNIQWSKRLEEAGCNVIYGVSEYKVHSKITLITSRNGNNIEYVTHFATGNYNEKTAKLYTDTGIITQDIQIGNDAVNFFNSLSTSLLENRYTHFLVAPHEFKNKIIRLIRDETEKAKQNLPALIRLKMNSITDFEIMEELIEAAMHGVKIDMIIRGICCLIPVTDNITVHSIVGRFLEHSRIFIFGSGDTKVYISSADLMTRNTTRRIELAVPVLDGKIRGRLIKMFDIYFTDAAKTSILRADTNYVKISGNSKPFNSQEYFMTHINDF